ncbi:3916_t:CDS:2 [Ambispora gerdemannii]|uniref:3916_t:CDS:1 n=1 Tax=Ambispora gerdemannii TaxID=144530 RepID=A0A9N9CIB8_9GLOM|nr:3916_t:CDS:2 [Ambispora gerdemannii]
MDNNNDQEILEHHNFIGAETIINKNENGKNDKNSLNTKIEIDHISSESTQGVDLSWKDLSYEITNSKTKKRQKIIENMYGVIEAGEVLGVLGPSGSGKSTLLDVLAGRKDKKLVSGEICLNGKPGQPKHLSTYVMQEHVMNGVLTVRESIQFAADLCFPKSYSAADRRARVQQIITEFGLDRVAESKIGTNFVRGISGGEKRRASIATQILTHPKIIFLDEPTTGLDSAASYNVIKVIVEMAQKYNLTVIASLHQPSTKTFELLDKICLIARGRTVYFGDREPANDFFERAGYPVPSYFNPADHFLYVINSDFNTDKRKGEDYVMKLSNEFKNSRESAEIQEKITTLIHKHQGKEDIVLKVMSKKKSRYERNFFQQFIILLNRCYKNNIRNILLFWIRMSFSISLSLLMVSYWWKLGDKLEQDSVLRRMTAHFYSITLLTSLSVAAVPVFLEERLLFERERSNHFYSAGPYALSHTIMSLPFVLIITLTFTSISYPLVALNNDIYSIINFIILLFLAALASESTVIFISAIIPDFVIAISIASFAHAFWMMSSGYVVTPSTLPLLLSWAYRINYQRYTYEAILVNDFVGLKFGCQELPLAVDDMPLYSCLYGDKSGLSSQFSGADVLQELQYDETKIWLWTVR